MQLTAIDHVQLTMPAGEEDRARAFYAGVLGLPEQPKPPVLAARGGCWFDNGQVAVHLGVKPDFRPENKGHPAFRVADLDDAARTLEAAGHPVTFDDSLPGVRRFYTADPFGNRLELMEPARS